MLFQAPSIDHPEQRVIAQIDDLRNQLRLSLHEPRRWQGSLRRQTFARNLQASNSIEGFDADLDDAAAVAMGEEPLGTTEETRLALDGYRAAMTYVLQLANEEDCDFRYDARLLKSLHFMMTSYAFANRPGSWRAGSIFVHDADTERVVHEGADIDLVPDLMDAVAAYLNDSEDLAIVKAAMAHLNLVMIHPFRDGNGRMARCLQSLVLARGRVLSPEFMSIEEYLGRNTQAYYRILAQVGGGSWQPERDARPWLRFVLTAHLRQARTLRQRFRDGEALWVGLTRLVGTDDERALAPLFDAAMGMRVRRATFVRQMQMLGEEISDATASRDLRILTERGLLVPHGEKRGRYYVAGAPVKELMREIRSRRADRDDTDPFAEEGNA